MMLCALVVACWAVSGTMTDGDGPAAAKANIAGPQSAGPLESGIVRTVSAIPTRGDWGGWLRYFRGDTQSTRDMVVLAVTLNPGQAPHPPHKHVEEEFMILTEGSGTWHLDGKDTAARKGDVLYAAPWSMHGLKNTGDSALTYYMVKWSGKGMPAPPRGDLDRGPNWEKVTNDAGWRPRDSAGELVYKDRLWILGGWFDSFQAPPRDVWSSPDGKTWKLITPEAPWKHSDLPMSLVFKERMWLMGGWYNGRLPGHEASNQVWSSTDGVQWDQETAQAGWSPRIAAGAVVFKGKMWILGGTEDYYFGDDKSLKNDVWCSTDGKQWELATGNAGWSPRAYHQAVVLGDKIYVLGGGNYVPQYQALNDVWCSSDGVSWERVVESAPWHPRLWSSAVTYRDRIWVLGGWSNNPSKNWGDVWYSKDGRAWRQLESDIIWKERHEHSAYVFRDKLWIAGGHAQPLSSEVWSLDVPQGSLPED